MKISKFSAASVTATIFIAAFSTATMAALGTEQKPAMATVVIGTPGVSAHSLTEVPGLQVSSVVDNTEIARGAVTTSIPNSTIGLQWSLGDPVTGQTYAWREITREDGTEKIRIVAKTVSGTQLDSYGAGAGAHLRVTATGTSAAYRIDFRTGAGALVAGEYKIGMKASTYTE